jgi:membrane protease YdiL (CAAX protease family)
MKNRYNEVVKELSDKELLFHLYGTQILLLSISAILAFILFDSLPDFVHLFQWNDPTIWFIGGGAGLTVVMVDLLLTKVLPDHYYDDGGLNDRIFRNRNVIHIVFIAGVVAFSEEVLFRGVLQTHFGLLVTSTIFALIHFRYLFNWFLFINIILLSFFIGYIYAFTGNLSVTIFMHFLIDFLLGLVIRMKQYKIDRNGRDVHE